MKPSENEKFAAIDKIAYELQMLRFSTKLTLEKTKREAEMGSIFRDSAILHARNLFYFFIKQESTNDDILAVHFSNRDNKRHSNFNGLHERDEFIKYINKFRSHLSYKRVNIDYNDIDKRLKNFYLKIEDAFEDFLKKADPIFQDKINEKILNNKVERMIF